jgi:AcrR family transcriptional regulator
MTRTVGSHGPKTMEAIRKAGLRLIFHHGFEAMNLRDLASEVGIQAGSLYNHITSKQELLFDLIKDHLEHLLIAVDQALETASGPVERMHTFVGFHVSYHMVRKREIYIANFELRSLEPKNYAVIVKLRREYEKRIIDILDEGVAQGVFDVADTHVASFAILAMLTGICTWYRPSGRLDGAQIVDIYTNLVMRGLLCDNSAAKDNYAAWCASGRE